MNKRVVASFREKANFFNNFFALQCTPIINISKLPSAVQHITENSLTRATIKMRML